MRRREFIAGLGGAATWPLVARAQQPTMPAVGFMSGRSQADSDHLVTAFREGLTEAGFTEGINVTIVFRWADGQPERLPRLAAELVARPVTVLVGVGGDLSARAAKRATSTIPVIFGMGDDPVKAGLVDSFNRPGGNATGYTLWTNRIARTHAGRSARRHLVESTISISTNTIAGNRGRCPSAQSEDFGNECK